jgi:glycerol-3-phosphate acyltransferase PlsY
MTYWFWIVLGYLSGSVMYCAFLPKLLLKKDICALREDHNPGTANVFMTCGVPLGILCLLLELLKGMIPVYLASQRLNTQNLLFSIVLAAPTLGHAFPIFRHFQGGKCIAVSFGVSIGILMISWVGFLLAGIYIFFSLAVRIHPHDRRSVAAFLLFALLATPLLLFERKFSLALGLLLIDALAIFKHLLWINASNRKNKKEESV